MRTERRTRVLWPVTLCHPCNPFMFSLQYRWSFHARRESMHVGKRRGAAPAGMEPNRFFWIWPCFTAFCTPHATSKVPCKHPKLLTWRMAWHWLPSSTFPSVSVQVAMQLAAAHAFHSATVWQRCTPVGCAWHHEHASFTNGYGLWCSGDWLPLQHCVTMQQRQQCCDRLHSKLKPISTPDFEPCSG